MNLYTFLQLRRIAFHFDLFLILVFTSCFCADVELIERCKPTQFTPSPMGVKVLENPKK